MKPKGVTVSGNIVDVLKSEIYPGKLEILDGMIVNIMREDKAYSNYIIPGFVDAHFHNFSIGEIKVGKFRIQPKGDKINVIEAIEGQVITDRSVATPHVVNGFVELFKKSWKDE